MSARGDNARRILETTIPAWFCDMLRSFHAGSDRGELRALLVEAWGPSPAVSDLRGLAARESQPARNIRDAQSADELADLARGPRL